MPRLPSGDRLLQRLFSGAEQPIIAVDRAGKVLFTNRALHAWIGGDAAAWSTKVLVFGGEISPADISQALAPPPEVWEGLGLSRLLPALGSDPADRRRIVFTPIVTDGGVSAVIGIVLTAPTMWQDSPPPESAALHLRLQELTLRAAPRFALPLLGDSPAAKRLREQVRIAAETRTRTLIVGPAGSQREAVARAVYPTAKHLKGLLVPVACPLIDAESLQAAVAGFLRRRHEAPDTRPAALLLLDVDRLRPDAQLELAGFLQLPNLELPLIATAARSPAMLSAKGKFRADLTERLTSLVIRLPRLRERPEDIPILAQKILEEIASAGGPGRSGFTTKAADELAGYEWPGELDELRDVVRTACDRATRPAIDAADLPDKIRHAADAVAHPRKPDEPIVLDEFLAGIEREVIVRAVGKARGNKTKAALLLGMTRARLLRKLVQFGLAAPAEEEVVFEPMPDEPAE